METFNVSDAIIEQIYMELHGRISMDDYMIWLREILAETESEN